MATSPLFGWQEPDDTSLVKDGAAAIRTLGNAIDASMGDLLGGTTGQVLAKASNTNMDFTWVAQDDSNAIQNAIVDAKGDLIAATANDTPARLAVGNNGETLVADSSTSTGLRYQANFAAGKNKIINGDFGIWQRGTSFTLADNAFFADRWTASVTGTPTSATVSRQTFTPGTAPVAGYEGTYFLRSTITTVGTLSNVDLIQKIEDVRTFAGQTVTLSFWAKSDSTRTSLVYLYQNTGTGGSGSAFGTPSTPSITTTTSWTRYSFTIALGSLSGATIGTNSYVQVAIRQAVAAGSVLDIWGVQVEASNTATAFQTATGTIQGELAACQRYYWRFNSDAGSTYQWFGLGLSKTTTTAELWLPNPVPMRVGATSLDFANLMLSDLVNYNLAVSAANLSNVNTQGSSIAITNATGATALRTAIIRANNSSSAYIGASAEL